MKAINIDKRLNRQGYLDGKQGIILIPNKPAQYVKGWNKGFKKFVKSNPSIFFSGRHLKVEEAQSLKRVGLKEEFIAEAFASFLGEKACA